MKGGSRCGTLSGAPRVILEKRDARNEAKYTLRPRVYSVIIFYAICPKYYRDYRLRTIRGKVNEYS